MAAGASSRVVEIDRSQRLHQRRDRLHVTDDAHVLAVGHAAFEAAGAVGRPGRSAGRRAPAAGSRRGRAIRGGRRCSAPEADAHALDGGNRHHGLRQPAIELAIPLRVADPRPGGRPRTITSKVPPRVSPAVRRLVDPRRSSAPRAPHPRSGADCVGGQRRRLVEGHDAIGGEADLGDGDHVARDRQRRPPRAVAWRGRRRRPAPPSPGRWRVRARRARPRARTSGPRRGRRVRVADGRPGRGWRRWRRRAPRRSVCMVRCQFTQSRFSMSSATGAPVVRPRRTPDCTTAVIGFDGHAAAAAVAALPAPEGMSEPVEIDGKTGGQAIDDDHEAAAMRLAGGEKPQHRARIVYEVSAPAAPRAPPAGERSRRAGDGPWLAPGRRHDRVGPRAAGRRPPLPAPAAGRRCVLGRRVAAGATRAGRRRRGAHTAASGERRASIADRRTAPTASAQLAMASACPRCRGADTVDGDCRRRARWRRCWRRLRPRRQPPAAPAAVRPGRRQRAMRQLRDVIPRAAASPFPVLIEGESGVGKEAGRARRARRQPRRQRSVRRRQLRRAGRRADRRRAVRPRPWRLHRRGRRTPGPVRRGPRRHALPRRGRRAVAAWPGQAAARAAGGRGAAARRERRRAGSTCGWSRPPTGRSHDEVAGRPVPRRSALPARRRPAARAAAARATRRHRRARRTLLAGRRTAHRRRARGWRRRCWRR